MNNRGPFAKLFVVVLVVAIQLVAVPTAIAEDKGTLAGTVFAIDGKQPVDGAVLYAGDMRTGEIYTSTATDQNGSFVLSDLPAAAYELAVEKEGGLYLVDGPVQLASGQTRDVQVAIHPNSDAAADPKTAGEEGLKKGFLDNPVIATFGIIGFATLVGWLISEADSSHELIASPFLIIP